MLLSRYILLMFNFTRCSVIPLTLRHPIKWTWNIFNAYELRCTYFDIVHFILHFHVRKCTMYCNCYVGFFCWNRLPTYLLILSVVRLIAAYLLSRFILYRSDKTVLANACSFFKCIFHFSTGSELGYVLHFGKNRRSNFISRLMNVYLVYLYLLLSSCLIYWWVCTISLNYVADLCLWVP